MASEAWPQMRSSFTLFSLSSSAIRLRQPGADVVVERELFRARVVAEPALQRTEKQSAFHLPPYRTQQGAAALTTPPRLVSSPQALVLPSRRLRRLTTAGQRPRLLLHVRPERPQAA